MGPGADPSKATIVVGDTLRYGITVKNRGGGMALGVAAVGNVPEGLDVVEVSGCITPTVTCESAQTAR